MDRELGKDRNARYGRGRHSEGGALAFPERLIEAPTLLLWGEQDSIMPRSYADRFAKAIKGRSETRIIPGAGHLAELDKPDETARAILDWTK